jgi:xanthine dehydrogenase accessory factor
VREDRSTVGTLGGGCVEAEVIRRTHKEAMASGESSLMSFQLNHDWGWDDGLVCGGRMDIGVMPIDQTMDLTPYRAAIEAGQRYEATRFPVRVQHEGRWLEYHINLEARPPLLIVGAGHVGQALARLAVDLDFHVIVLDDRADFASPERFPAGVELRPGSMVQTLENYPIDPTCYVVIVTRGHQHDQQALEAVINTNAKYIGLIGSRRKKKVIFDDMEKRGVTDASTLERVHSPIGLDIGAVTVPEIATSIAAELVQQRRQVSPQLVSGPVDVTERARLETEAIQ